MYSLQSYCNLYRLNAETDETPLIENVSVPGEVPILVLENLVFVSVNGASIWQATSPEEESHETTASNTNLPEPENAQEPTVVLLTLSASGPVPFPDP